MHFCCISWSRGDPELDALGLLGPKAEDLLGVISQDAERDVDRLIADKTCIVAFGPDGVKENDWQQTSSGRFCPMCQWLTSSRAASRICQ